LLQPADSAGAGAAAPTRQSRVLVAQGQGFVSTGFCTRG
jgi:hypothetical protein